MYVLCLQGEGQLGAGHLLVPVAQHNSHLVVSIGEERRQIHVGYEEFRGRKGVGTLKERQAIPSVSIS